MTLDWGAFRFMAWDGYHHHLAVNLVEGRNAAPVNANINGLESFSVQHDARGEQLVDPNGIRIEREDGSTEAN